MPGFENHTPADIKEVEMEDGQTAQPMPPQKKAAYRRFALVVFMIFAPIQVYIGWRLIPDLPVNLVFKVFGAMVVAISTVLIPYGTLASVFVKSQAVADRLVWAGSLTLGWFSSLLIFTLIRDIALLFVDGRNWVAESAVLALALSVLVTLIGFLNARRIAKVVNVDIPLDNLPLALEGFTIAQITDIHVGPTIKGQYVQGVVNRVNALNPDIIAITGDVVDGRVDQLAKDTAPLGKLDARYGVYLVTGNHEYYSGAEEWIDEFRRIGLQVLMNEHEVIRHNNTDIIVAGVNDYSAGKVIPAHKSDPDAAISGSPSDPPKILLAHQPRSADAAAKAGFDLQLSGHTHGGQFWPWNHFVRLQQPFTAGLRRLGHLWVYTSRGTGYWGPPKRFGAPSEITLIKLSKAS
ncbi:metallophosphoesterase [Sneathiella marina]|uniref:Metallophosphoesterase n=2 Tax=Sneathiella marina TaxID=2950108 RepID=A0ABY4W4A6_9PROT|nr:metallophosphoesterase [Sneathiella marina]USG62025.1 metallophosphoesterase [Sneathiella marina]